MRKKTTVTTTQNTSRAKNVDVDMYYNTIAHQMAPSTKDHKRRMGIALMEWARNEPRAYSPIKFILDQGMTYRTWERWKAADPELQEMHDVAMAYIANRRESGALEKTLDGNFIRFTQCLYDQRFKELEEWRSKLGEKGDEGGTKIVIMENFKEE